MDFSKLRRGEFVAIIGGILLLVSLFTKTYETRPQNRNANIDGMGCGGRFPGDCTFSWWQVHDILRILVLVGAIAPFVLAYIIVRDHKLSWPRGELTAVIGIALVGFIFYTGVIDRPGDPPGEIELEIGWYGLILGAILMVLGGALRSGESERKRKPPGVL